MVLIRVFEQLVAAESSAGRIPGFIHLSVGQEAVAVGVCAGLRPSDLMTSTHRGHGHAIAKGTPLTAILAELMGRVDGVCKGRGGSMHLIDVANGMLGGNGIVGGSFGIAAGAALSAVIRQSKQVVACLFGDGAIDKGGFHEACNFAAARRMPVLFVCENNGLAGPIDTASTTSVSELAQRAAAYGMPGHTVDGGDVRLVMRATRAAALRARAGRGPTLLVMRVRRVAGHSGPDTGLAGRRTYGRDDPLVRAEAALTRLGLLEDRRRDAIWDRCARSVAGAHEIAARSPWPDPADVERHVVAAGGPA
jgi:TPP-dependent pyruvate/acetoin dehydrogenase alpha subunit